jgi:hypothetical protein
MGFSFQEDFGVTPIFLGYEFFKHFLDFAFAGFYGKFSGQSIAGTEPDFIRNICDDTGFDPSSAFQTIGFKDVGR